MDLRGRRVLVTGASRGIGEAIVRRLAPTGASLALVARQEKPLTALAAELGAVAYPADLSDPHQVSALIQRVEADGPVDVLVNNAGIDNCGAFTAQSAEELRQIYQVNLLAPAELCRRVIPNMVGRGRGHIVNVSSTAGVAVLPGLVAYSSTKAGLSQLTAGLRADLKGLPIGTTLVELGPIPTEMLSKVDSYRPAAKAFRRLHQLGVLVDVSKERVAADVVEAIERDRRHVRLPRRAAVFPLMVEAPRRIVELLLSGVEPRA